MKTLSSLKKDLEFNKGLASLIEVLKNIAVSQYRALEDKIKTYEKYFTLVQGFFDLLDVTTIDHIFLTPKTNSQIVVAITSDSGMLGGLNMQVIHNALAELARLPGRLVVIGERGKAYAAENRVSFAAFPGISEQDYYSQAMQLRDYLMDKVRKDRVGYLKVIYPRPISFTIQRVETISVLPFVVPPHQKSGKSAAIENIIIESHPAAIVEYLVYLWMGQKLYEVFGLSRLAEFAARYVHLEESSQKLKEMDKKLRLQYFRVRHELIDRDMRELFASRLLYAR